MSQPESRAPAPSPADCYPSPPTSPQSVKVADKTTQVNSNAKLSPEVNRDSDTQNKAPVIQKEHARPVTPTESTDTHGEDCAAAKDAIKLGVWKEALALSNMKCGATTTKNRPCKNKISAIKTKSMDEAIRRLWTPYLSSSEVEAHLDSLAKLVHCHYHDHPTLREARIDHWITVLPGPQRLPSVQRRLRKILGPAPSKCTSLTPGNEPCNVQVGEKRFYYGKTMEKLVQMAIEPNDEDESLPFLVKVLQHYTLCADHQEEPYKHQNNWTIRISKFRAACQLEIKKNNSKRLGTKRVEEEHEKRAVDESRLPSPPPTPRRLDAVQDPSKYWDTKFETSKLVVLGKGDLADEDKFTAHKIQDLARTQLDTSVEKEANEVNEGFVYLYQVPGNDNVVKIGFTTRSIAKRHKEWKDSCHREPTPLYPAAATCELVPHACRVEKLVHMELIEHCVRIYCDRCEKQHIEWFEVSAEDAIAVIEKWSLWAQKRPYEKRVTRQGVRWYLKEEETKRLADINKFMTDLQKEAKNKDNDIEN